jgi:hypothetical protein
MKVPLMLKFLQSYGLGLALLITSCQERMQNKTKEGCDEAFFLCLNDESNQTICSNQNGEYIPEDQLYQFYLTDKNLAGNTAIIIKIKPFNGIGIYRPGKNNGIQFDMHVKGATDELYHGFEGWMKVTPESSNTFMATFEISLEGFYNKKIIHATGWMKIADSFQQYSNNSP